MGAARILSFEDHVKELQALREAFLSGEVLDIPVSAAGISYQNAGTLSFLGATRNVHVTGLEQAQHLGMGDVSPEEREMQVLEV